MALGLMLIVATGCTVFDKRPAGEFESLLKPMQTSPDSVTLEVFHVRFHPDEVELAEELWRQVDEQRLDAASRRALVSNGFRAGVIGGTLPDVLAEALNLQSEMPEIPPMRIITDQTARPRVERRVLQLDRHEQASIHASELREQIDLLVNGEDGLHGKSYTQAESVYSMRVLPSTGQRIELRLTPEVHHGQLRNRYAGSDQGIFVVTPSREHEVFDALQIRVELAPGELLVAGCLSDAAGSLGNAFHTTQIQGRNERKLILVRLLQVPPTEILVSR